MTTPSAPDRPPAAKSGPGRRIAAVAGLCVLLFLGLLYAAFNVMTAALIASGAGVVVVAAGSWSDAAEGILDAIANVVLAVLAAIGAFFAAIFTLFWD